MRELVRVHFDGETAWGEHVEGNIYRALNSCMSDVLVAVPADHEDADKNGQMVRLLWGHLFEGVPWAQNPNGEHVVPVKIVGRDLTPRPGAEGDR